MHVGGYFTRHTLLLAAQPAPPPKPFPWSMHPSSPIPIFHGKPRTKHEIVLPCTNTVFFFSPYFSSSTPPQPWSSKPNYVPSRNPVSTLDTAPCAADVTGKRSGWAPKKPNLCTNKEKSHKSWPGHKPGDVFTRKTWTTDKRKK